MSFLESWAVCTIAATFIWLVFSAVVKDIRFRFILAMFFLIVLAYIVPFVYTIKLIWIVRW